MLCIVYVWKQTVDPLAKLGYRFRKRFIELIVQKHQVEHAIMGYYWLLNHTYEVHYSCNAERVYSLAARLCHF